MGILLAITALLSWGLGDFLIQRSARRFGDWIALFYITAFGSLVLFPFVYRDLGAAFEAHSLVLWIASAAILFAALLDFEALRVGKISVIEPIYAFEIPVTALLAAYVIREGLSVLQIAFIANMMVGIFLISTRSFAAFRKFRFENGVWLAIFATIGMGASNFLFGLGSRATNPLVVNWFTDVCITAVALIYLGASARLGEVAKDFRANKKLIFNVSFFDNLAWVAFSAAMLYIPMGVATGISEGYIAFAGGLGLLLNNEKLRPHQWVGFVVAIVSVIILAFITG